MTNKDKLEIAIDKKLEVSWREIRDAIIKANSQINCGKCNDLLPNEKPDIHALIRRVASQLPHDQLLKDVFKAR